MTGRESVPIWSSLGPISLFRSGPWELILPQWIVGLLLTIAWMATPAIRVSAVTDWRIALVIGAALAGTLAVQAFGRVWGDPRVGDSFILATMSIAAVAAAALSRTVLAPSEERASACAPLFVSGESGAGHIASYVVPAMLYVSWCMYLIAHFPRSTREDDDFLASSTRYSRYTRAVSRLLPTRIASTAATVILIAALALSDRLPSNLAPSLLASALREPVAAAIDRASGGVAFRQLAGARRAAEERASAMLAELDLDHARPLVTRCACDWLAPGDRSDVALANAVAAYADLDEEIDIWARRWKPSPATAAAVLRLVPLRGGLPDTPPLFPLQWQTAGATGATEAVRDETFDVSYRGEPVMRVQRTTRGTALARISVKLLGTTGRGDVLPDIISGRLGIPPSEGPCPLRRAYCVSWKSGRFILGLSPDDVVAPGGDAPMWLSVSDSSVVPVPPCCGAPQP